MAFFSFSLNCQTPRQRRPAIDHFFSDPEETLCSYRGCTSPYSVLFYRRIGNRKSIRNGQDQGSLRAVNTKRKDSNLRKKFLNKNLLSAKKIAGGSMRNRRAPGLTKNTDHSGHFQPKTPTSDLFFSRKI